MISQSPLCVTGPVPSDRTTSCRLGGGSVDGKVSVGFSPNAPLAVGNSSAGPTAATAVAAGTVGPRVAAVVVAEELVGVPPPSELQPASSTPTASGTERARARTRIEHPRVGTGGGSATRNPTDRACSPVVGPPCEDAGNCP